LSFYDRYAKYCKLVGIMPVSQEAAEALGVSKSTISSFAKNGTTPKGDTVARAAKMLGVSADCLLDIDEHNEDGSISSQERRLIETYRCLSKKGKKTVDDVTEAVHKAEQQNFAE